MTARLLVLALFLMLQRPAICGAEEQPESADICAVLADAIAYDHKLIRLTGQVSRGFEDFTLRHSACDNELGLWLEYGGPEPAGTIYCCVGEDSSRPNGKDPLSVEGIQTSLRADATFKRFDRITKQLRRGKTVKATLIGRLFSAGTYVSESGDEQQVGYGHFGMFSLFVIQEVVAVNGR